MEGRAFPWEHLELTPIDRRVLDAVAEQQLSEGEGPTVDAILLRWPHEVVQGVRAAIKALVDQDLVTVGSLSSGHETLHLTPVGLLASRHAGQVSALAEDVLRFFHRRTAEPTVAFRSFDWSDLKSDGIGQALPFIRVTLHVLELAQERFYAPGQPDARWDVPSDIVDLRGLSEIGDIYARVARRREGLEVKSARLGSRGNRRVNSATAVADAIGFAHVLAVGVSDYMPSSNFHKLRQCVYDAKEFAACFRNKAELQSSAERVHELTTAGLERPSRGNVIAQVRALATRAKADDRIVFYFSGHGQKIEDKLYLVPEDAWADDEPAALISMEMVNQFLSASQAKIKIVILDACNTGPTLSDLKHPAGKWSESFLADYIRHSAGVVTLASSLADQPSSTKSPHPNLSLFTHFVINGLNGDSEALDDGLLTVESLFAYVSTYVKRVSTSHHRPQQPAISLSSSGTIFLGDFREPRSRLPAGSVATSVVERFDDRSTSAVGNEANKNEHEDAKRERADTPTSVADEDLGKRDSRPNRPSRYFSGHVRKLALAVGASIVLGVATYLSGALSQDPPNAPPDSSQPSRSVSSGVPESGRNPEASIDAVPPEVLSSSSSSSPIAKRQEGLDQLHDLFAVDAREVYDLGIGMRAERSIRSFAKRLDEFQVRYTQLNDRVLSTWTKYRHHFEVLGTNSEQFLFLELTTRTNALSEHIQKDLMTSSPNDQFSLLQEDIYYSDWGNALNNFANWINERRGALTKLRQQVSAAEPTSSYDLQRSNAAVAAFLKLMGRVRQIQERCANVWLRWKTLPDSVSMSSLKIELDAVDIALSDLEVAFEVEWRRYEAHGIIVGKSATEWTERTNQFRGTVRAVKDSMEALRSQSPNDSGSRLVYKTFMEGWKGAMDALLDWIEDRTQFLASKKQSR